jgi:hypothetical protein
MDTLKAFVIGGMCGLVGYLSAEGFKATSKPAPPKPTPVVITETATPIDPAEELAPHKFVPSVDTPTLCDTCGMAALAKSHIQDKPKALPVVAPAGTRGPAVTTVPRVPVRRRALLPRNR